MMKPYPKIQRAIVAAGLCVLAVLFLFWLGDGNGASPAEFYAALLCLLLFVALCLRFVPQWFGLWFGPEQGVGTRKGLPLWRLFALGLLCCAVQQAAVWAVLYYANRSLTPQQFLEFWRSADAYHYLCIARDWYLSEGDWDRVVQLVFLPGYPLAVRAVSALVGDELVSGLIVSCLSFSGALCVFYKLALLDHDEGTALRAVIFLCLTPGAFFFAAPMSESFFLLLSASCLLCARKERWLLAGLLGALASFTRSLGLMLFAPLFMEMIAGLLHGNRRVWRALAALVLIPLGFAAYCLVNYLVSGDPFRFMIYQREHWHQSLGLFFNTAAYQTRYALTAERNTLLGLWLPNLTAIFAALAILIAGAKRLRASYTLWAIAYFAVAVGATWLLSAPRYLSVLLPIPLCAAFLSEKKPRRIVLLSLYALAGAYYLVMFALRRNVW